MAQDDVKNGGFKKRPQVENVEQFLKEATGETKIPIQMAQKIVENLKNPNKQKIEIGGTVTVRFPKEVWDMLSYFDANLATRYESKNSFIVTAVQKELENRIQRSK